MTDERLKAEAKKKDGRIVIPLIKARKIAAEVWDHYFVTNKILIGIRNKSQKDNTQKFDNLYHLLTREDFIIQAITNLRANKGTSTPGIDMATLEGLADFHPVLLSDSIKNHEYRFRPVKRVWIPKPGKKEKRPLGIPTFGDRVVQEMCRMILEAIYEPEFELRYKNSNYGFRPKKSTHDAIETIKIKAQNLEHCVEGDIVGAFVNVSHDRLIEILGEKISDQEFLSFIRQGLQSGVIDHGTYQHTLLGTPQGGIASPILFNIYMSKLDEFINNHIANEINQWNVSENRMKKPETKSYKKLQYQTYKNKKKLKEITSKENLLQPTPRKEWSSESKVKYEETVALIKQTEKRRLEVPYSDKKRTLLRFCYVRYADDWVFFTNCDRKRTEYIKERISEFLLQDLKLELSPEKTKLTNVKTEKVKFLGFTMSYYANTIRRLRITSEAITKPKFQKGFQIVKLKQQITINHLRRTTGNQLVIGIDQDRLDSRLKQKRFMTTFKNMFRGRRKTEWTTLTDYEIIMRFNYVIRGLVNYYAPMVRDFSLLNKYIYILNYSCAHTLASKHHTTIRRVFQTFGKPITAEFGKKKTIPKKNNKEKRITLWKETENTQKEEKKVTLLSYLACRAIAQKQVTKEKTDQDFLCVRINWRTAYKMSKHCVICGSMDKVEMHHMKHVRKMGKTSEGFKQVISILNRKQICVCYKCHRRIHNGTYDGLRLSDFYDPELATF